MNCRNAFQIEQKRTNAFEYLENRMTNRASGTVLWRSALYFRKNVTQFFYMASRIFPLRKSAVPVFWQRE